MVPRSEFELDQNRRVRMNRVLIVGRDKHLSAIDVQNPSLEDPHRRLPADIGSQRIVARAGVLDLSAKLFGLRRMIESSAAST